MLGASTATSTLQQVAFVETATLHSLRRYPITDQAIGDASQERPRATFLFAVEPGAAASGRYRSRPPRIAAVAAERPDRLRPEVLAAPARSRLAKAARRAAPLKSRAEPRWKLSVGIP